jgi:hypothetical protein
VISSVKSQPPFGEKNFSRRFTVRHDNSVAMRKQRQFRLQFIFPVVGGG